MTAAKSNQGQDSSSERSTAGPDEETKRKFREALARKQSHGGVDVSGSGGHAKAQGAHGPESSPTSQMFRRKSG